MFRFKDEIIVFVRAQDLRDFAPKQASVPVRGSPSRSSLHCHRRGLRLCRWAFSRNFDVHRDGSLRARLIVYLRPFHQPGA